MAKFKIKTSAQLKSLYLDALVETGQATALISGQTAKPVADAKETRVNKRGSIVIPKEMVEEFGFSIGQEFTVRKTRAGVSIKGSN